LRKEISFFMKEKNLTVQEIAQIAGTRVVLGAGIGLLLANKLTDHQRRGIGWALLAFGALSTIPIIANLREKKTLEDRADELAEVAG
jgi:hypothetical protein